MEILICTLKNSPQPPHTNTLVANTNIFLLSVLIAKSVKVNLARALEECPVHTHERKNTFHAELVNSNTNKKLVTKSHKRHNWKNKF